MSLLLANTVAEDPMRYIALAAGILGLAYLLLRPRKKRSDPLDKPSGTPSLGQQRNVERDMSHLLVELSNMSRQITAQLDTRAAKLEVLIQEADRRLAELRAATEGAAAGTPGGTPGSPKATEMDPRHAEVYRLADAGRTPQQIAQQLSRPDGEIELILALRPKPFH